MRLINITRLVQVLILTVALSRAISAQSLAREVAMGAAVQALTDSETAARKCDFRAASSFLDSGVASLQSVASGDVSARILREQIAASRSEYAKKGTEFGELRAMEGTSRRLGDWPAILVTSARVHQLGCVEMARRIEETVPSNIPSRGNSAGTKVGRVIKKLIVVGTIGTAGWVGYGQYRRYTK